MAKILIVSTDWGHGSIAKGVKDAIGGSHKTDLAIIGVEKFSKASYEFIYKFIPGFFRIIFFLSSVDFLRQLFNYYAENSYKKRLKLEIKKSKPDIVINTYFAFNSSLEELKKEFGFRFINVLADPLTFSRVLISLEAENLVFDEYSFRKMKSFSPKAQGQPVGWFSEKKFYEIAKEGKRILRKSLDLKPDKFTLCITSGSEGTYHVLKIVNTFLNPKYDMQVVIMCGNNKQMLDAVKALRSVSETIGGPNIIGVPYTTEIHKYLRAADLVIGKAGPNTIFETVAALTPFFVISHVAGQEDGNLNIIKKYKIGYVEENIIRATKILQKIIENPKLLNRFNKNLRKLSTYCRSSENKLISILET